MEIKEDAINAAEWVTGRENAQAQRGIQSTVIDAGAKDMSRLIVQLRWGKEKRVKVRRARTERGETEKYGKAEKDEKAKVGTVKASRGGRVTTKVREKGSGEKQAKVKACQSVIGMDNHGRVINGAKMNNGRACQ